MKSFLVIIGFSLGLALPFTSTAQQPDANTATGKILVFPSNEGPSSKEMPNPLNLYGTHIEILQSKELHRRAWERQKALEPELEEVEVKITANVLVGTGIIVVSAVSANGSGPLQNSHFLDALLKEYIALIAEIEERRSGGVINKTIEEVLNREKETKAKLDVLDTFAKQNNIALIEEDMKQARETIPKAKDKSTIEAARKSVADFNEKIVEYQRLKRDYEQAMIDYNDWKKALDRVLPTGSFLFQSAVILQN